MYTDIEYIPTVIIGAGQAGLSVGYHLARRKQPFVILDSNERVGDNWRHRWDSLRLFTPASLDGLAGMSFPARSATFPTKDAMADYLEAYAGRFRLPVRTGVTVDRVSRQGHQFLVTAGATRLLADQVVVAMATFQQPRVPAFAADLDPGIVQLHSRDYRNLGQLRDGGVLVVGAGNSGADIALEAARGHHATWLAGRDTGHVPFDIDGFVGRHILIRVVLRLVFHRLLTLDTPKGRKAAAARGSQGGPLIRHKPRDFVVAGIERVPRMAGVRGGRPVLDDGRDIDVANVIWCTGFEPGFSWIDLPVFDPTGAPRHTRGVVADAPGLYFLGLHFLYAMSSTMIHGVNRDAEHVAEAIQARARVSRPTALEEAAPV